jgi:WD repeat-containing protein 35
LIEYEKELTTKVVYSLVALAAAYSGVYYECSKAFVKLENMEELTQDEKDKYEAVAVAIFSRKPPIADKKAMMKCPAKSCDAAISE